MAQSLFVTLLSSFPGLEHVVASDPALEVNYTLVGYFVHDSASGLHLGHGEVLLCEESLGLIDGDDAVIVGVTPSESPGLFTVIKNSESGVRRVGLIARGHVIQGAIVSKSPLHISIVPVNKAVNCEIALRDICQLVKDLRRLLSLNRSHVDPSNAG